MNPEVSIIMPTYNSEAYIKQALRSVFDQSYSNWELIIVDDGSSDSTVDIARNYQDRRLKILKNSCNQGVSYSRNRGIKEARGKWIALLDSDDWYAPKRLEKLVSVGDCQDADLVADDLFLIENGQKHPWSSLLRENQLQSSTIESIDAVKFVVSDRLAPIDAKRNWSLGYTKPLIERAFLLKHDIWYREDIKVGEDFILYLECLRRRAKFCLLTQPYYFYQTRTHSLSTRKPTQFLAESCQITQEFIDLELNSQKNAKLIEALKQNLAIFQERLAYSQIEENIRAKRLPKAIGQIITTPSTGKDLVKKLMMFLRKRATGTAKKTGQNSNKAHSDNRYNFN